MTRYLEKYDELNRVLGRALREARTKQGISQMKLAGRLNISYQQVQKYEYGESQLTVPRLIQIAEALGIPWRIILDGELALSDTEPSRCGGGKECGLPAPEAPGTVCHCVQNKGGNGQGEEPGPGKAPYRKDARFGHGWKWPARRRAHRNGHR